MGKSKSATDTTAARRCVGALVRPRIPWTPQEDDDIRTVHAQANGAFPTYKAQADRLNVAHHGGAHVRTASAVRRREGYVVWGKPRGSRPNTEGQTRGGSRVV